jgi:hypothetical protein
MTRRWRWRTCVNCGAHPVAGCLCMTCLRAMLVPLVLAALVQWAMGHLR